MTIRYHINERGIPAPCSAKPGNCPFGGETGLEDHYLSKEEAQDAIDKKNEEEFGLISIIESESVENANDTKHVRKKLMSVVKEKGIENLGEKEYVKRAIDEGYIRFASNPRELQKEFARYSFNVVDLMDKRYEARLKHTDAILKGVRTIEDKYNSQMKEIISKEVTETRERSSEGSGKLGLSASKDLSDKGIISGGLTGKGSRKKKIEERRDLGLGKRDIRKNKRIKKQRRRLENKKDYKIDSLLNKRIVAISKMKADTNRHINEELRKGIEYIKDPNIRRQALVHLEELSELQSKTIIPESDRKSLIYQFRKANESRDEIEMRSCNRLVDILGENKRGINEYDSEGNNVITFEENYEKFSNGELFESISRKEFREQAVEIRKSLINCFDV